MAKFGYGGKEEDIYLQAYEYAKAGHPTLLFSFESARNKLMDILLSHLLKKDIKEVKEQFVELAEQAKEILDVPLTYVDVTSLTIEEIESVIARNIIKNQITHVFLDRVRDPEEMYALAKRLDVLIHF